jgi:hypothetical protein
VGIEPTSLAWKAKATTNRPWPHYCLLISRSENSNISSDKSQCSTNLPQVEIADIPSQRFKDRHNRIIEYKRHDVP